MDITINKKTFYTLVLTILLSHNVFAEVDINTFSPSIRTGFTYTDNVDLTHDNTDSDFVFLIDASLGAGGAGISTKGSRLRTQLNYGIKGMSYSANNDLNDINHDLSASATAEIVKNAIFLDAYANTRGVLLDQNRNASSDRVSGSENLTDTYNYGLTTSWNKKWAKYLTSDFRYTYDEVRFGGDSSESTSNSTGNTFDLQLASGPKFNQYFWDLNYTHSETSYNNDAPNTTTETSYVTLGYHFSRAIDLRVRLGYEDYNEDIDNGFGWTVGGTWNPSPRTSLDASWGERAFGRTAFLNFSHRSKRITWQVNYNDDVTNSRAQITNNSLAINDINANPDDNQNSNINNLNVPLTTYSPDLYLSRRLSGSASFALKRSSFNVSVYAERIYYDDADNKDNDNQGVSLGWGRRIGKNTSMNTTLSWDRLEDIAGSNTQNRKSLSWSFNRSFSPTFSAGINYSYRTNSADLRTSEYDENSISATISKSFR